jgi:plasmid maintenance system antidote protein VapI
MSNKLYRELLAKVPKETSLFVDHAVHIGCFVYDELQKSEKLKEDFMKLMDIDEDRLSKLMSGVHNFTLKEISKIEVFFGIEIINLK